MKHIATSVIIGALLVVPTVGAAFAANPHPSTTSGKGQPGSNNGISCGGPGANSAPSGAVNGNGSPFNPNPTTPNGIVYAGNPGNPTGPGGIASGTANSAAVSQYDAACFQATQMP
jgi:hypothetical protein